MAQTVTNPDTDTGYVDSTDYQKWGNKLREITDILETLQIKAFESRKLRYAEVDIEVEREAGRIQPDEVYIPVHTIDTNIRKEQSFYVQFIVQSPRAVIVEDIADPTVDTAVLEKDLTEKLRFENWQLSAFSNIDGMQANGYGVIEVVYDKTKAGHLSTECVCQGEFAFIADTKDIQMAELVGREYYYTRTKLLELCSDKTPEGDRFDKSQVDKILGKGITNTAYDPGESVDSRDRSLYKIQKVMFRKDGIVQVGWTCVNTCDDWIRKPRPLFLGRRKLDPESMVQKSLRMMKGVKIPPSSEEYEKDYPYFIYPYLISEDDTIDHLKGRIFFDQDIQEAMSSLLSSTITKARRSAGMYWAKDNSDPNDDVLMQKNVFFRQNCLIPQQVKAFPMEAPDAQLFGAIQMLQTLSQTETSQIAFAAQNRKDSRKTKKELDLAEETQQQLSSVQVTLYSISLRKMYQLMCDIIKSRVLCGLLTVNPQLQQLYARNFKIKPAGDVDVIERQKIIQTMMQAWPVIKDTPIGQLFLKILIELMFPQYATKFGAAFQQAEQQQQSQQAQQMQQMMQMVQQYAQGIVKLSEHPEWFSDVGRIHAFPIVENASQNIQKMLPQSNKQ